MNKIIEQRIKNLNDRIEYLSVSDAVRECKKEVRELSKIYKPTSIRAYLTMYRRFLKTDNSKIINSLKVKSSVQNKIQRDYDKKLSKTQKKLSKVKNIDKMLNLAVELLDSESVSEIVSGLCLLTGRRMTEILKTAKFKNSRNSKKVMLFEGQLKTEEQRTYEIYVLRDSKKECKKALKRLRLLVNTKKMSNYEVSRKYETSVNAKVNAYFQSYIGKCSAHDLRKVYATYCSEHFKEKSQTVNSFLSQILGHGSDDIKTANSYQKYYLE
jgi:integrase